MYSISGQCNISHAFDVICRWIFEMAHLLEPTVNHLLSSSFIQLLLLLLVVADSVWRVSARQMSAASDGPLGSVYQVSPLGGDGIIVMYVLRAYRGAPNLDRYAEPLISSPITLNQLFSRCVYILRMPYTLIQL